MVYLPPRLSLARPLITSPDCNMLMTYALIRFDLFAGIPFSGIRSQGQLRHFSSFSTRTRGQCSWSHVLTTQPRACSTCTTRMNLRVLMRSTQFGRRATRTRCCLFSRYVCSDYRRADRAMAQSAIGVKTTHRFKKTSSCIHITSPLAPCVRAASSIFVSEVSLWCTSARSIPKKHHPCVFTLALEPAAPSESARAPTDVAI